MKQKKKKRKRKIFLPLFLIFFIIIGFYSHQSYETAMHEQLPDSLIEFEQKYPEATDFVENYHKYKNKSFDLDVSHEVRKDNIPLFIQWDKRWGYKTYGSNFLGVNGCGPTSLSMVICGLTGKATWNPYKVAQFSQKQGYYISGQGTSWDLMTAGAKKLGLTSTEGTINNDYIRQNLTSSTPMICSMLPGDFTYSGHFIVLTGIDSEGRVVVNDPNSPKNSEKHWDMDRLFCHKSGISGNLRWKKLHNSLFYACLARCLLCQAPIVF